MVRERMRNGAVRRVKQSAFVLGAALGAILLSAAAYPHVRPVRLVNGSLSFERPLVIPPLLEPRTVDGEYVYELRAERGLTELLPGRSAHTVLGVFAAGSLVHRRAAWFQRSSGRTVTFTVLVGALIVMAVESWGLSTGRWQYTESMPRVPILGLGLVPLLQMPILAPITMGMAEWWGSGRREPDDRAAEDGRMRRS